MDEGSVGLARKGGLGWGLTPDVAAATQGLIVSPFGHLEYGVALFLQLGARGGGWLKRLRDVVAITDATKKVSPCAALAFSHAGLAQMNLDTEALASFSAPFSEGMFQEDRRRRLGDEDGAVVAGGPLWSGTDGGEASAGQRVHALLLLYDDSEDKVRARTDLAVESLTQDSVTVVRQTPLWLRTDAEGSQEHFGFVDGVSQPVPHGGPVVSKAAAPDAYHAVAAGDVLIGYGNAHGEPAPGPVVNADAVEGAGLPQGNAPQGFVDLGLNGSYLVVRELRQDVAKFWLSMDRAAAALGEGEVTADYVAERVVGRTRTGDPLACKGVIAPQDGQPANAFGFLKDDAQGFGCPLGSHIRRANPRDSLAARPEWAQDLLHAANNHRILRRGRKFGPTIANPRIDDGVERGLLFMALNTDIVRQFEFIQQTWMLNPSFGNLFEETDPLTGPSGKFTMPRAPVRLRADIESFVQVVGGEYFFLPSLPALDYLGMLT